jgi:hypothetical protein
MGTGLQITIVDVDDDYLGVEIAAGSGRFSGSAHIYAGVNQLSEFAQTVAGFPSSAADRRSFEFGTRDPKYAGGFVALTFHCRDGSGHPVTSIAIQDDDGFPTKASAEFTFPVEAAALDRFVQSLVELEATKRGSASLEVDFR